MTVGVAVLLLGMGLVLGLLGGGGSILAVPILVYAAGLEPRAAIATSLLVVGLTSLGGAIRHHRAGNVQWRTGLPLGLGAMVGGFVGGRLAGHLPVSVLLTLFAVLCLVAGVRMLRPRPDGTGSAVLVSPPSLAPSIALGLVLGLVTGMVGAGGGFLIVPALVLVAGLPMRPAIGTSLLVISLNSGAGLLGHLGHTAVDPVFAGIASATAMIGCLLGTALASAVAADRLRTLFGWLVILVSFSMLSDQLGGGFVELLLRPLWPFWLGGLALGVFILLFMLVDGHRLGVSSGFMDACAAIHDPSVRSSWRFPFLAGIITGGLLAAWSAGSWQPSFAVPLLDAEWGAGLLLKGPLFLVGGMLLGLGARLAGGCTSGHSMVGNALLNPSSLRVTLAFMGTGVLVANLLRWILGG